MPGPWESLLWLVGAIVLLSLLSRWLNLHAQGFLLLAIRNADMVMYIYFLVLFPGILLHELSHWAAAQLLGVHTKGITIMPRRGKGKQIYYGSVKIVPADPVRNSLIGLAPLISGSIAVLACAAFGLGIQPLSAPTSLAALWTYLSAPNALLWLYLIFAVSNAMLPSQSDREPWLPVILFLGIVIILLVATDAISKVPGSVTQVALFGVSYLAYSFTLTIALDILVALLVWIGEMALGYLRGQRVQY